MEGILYQRCQVFDILDQFYKMEGLIGMLYTGFKLSGWNEGMSQGSFVRVKYLINLKGSFAELL